MKKSIFGLFLIFALVQVTIAQNTPAPNESQIESIVMVNGPTMEIESLVLDYGTIEYNSEPLRVVKFTNTGTEPLVIKNARGSCGCTVPVWPKEPIMPGEESKIEIRYATNRVGKFSKTVTITTNEIGDPQVITVKGHVLKQKEGVPAAKPSILKSGKGGN